MDNQSVVAKHLSYTGETVGQPNLVGADGVGFVAADS
jgi:hypothetical protein